MNNQSFCWKTIQIIRACVIDGTVYHILLIMLCMHICYEVHAEQQIALLDLPVIMLLYQIKLETNIKDLG